MTREKGGALGRPLFGSRNGERPGEGLGGGAGVANGWEAIVTGVLALQEKPGDWRPGPSLQWFPKQWLGDDVVMMMGLPVRGYHFHLIMMAWQQSPPCSLPDDPLTLAGWCGDPEGWEAIWSRVCRAWKLYRGRWWQIGLCRAYLEQMGRRLGNREGGQKSARSRLAKYGSADPRVNSVHVAAELGSQDRELAVSVGVNSSSSSSSASAPANKRREEKEDCVGREDSTHHRRRVEIEWRVGETWAAYVRMRKWWCGKKGRQFRQPSMDPKTRAAIVAAIKAHDIDRLGEGDREEWSAQSPVRAAGIGVFLSTWHTGEDKENDAGSGEGKLYCLEPWRPWFIQRGKPDPVPGFAEKCWEARDEQARSQLAGRPGAHEGAAHSP